MNCVKGTVTHRESLYNKTFKINCIKGTVTHVNKESLCFRVGSVNVYVGCLLSQRSHIILPSIGETVHIENIHHHNIHGVYLCEETKLIDYPTDCSHGRLYKQHRLVELIRRYELGVADLMLINSHLNRLRLHFDPVAQKVSVWELLLSAVEVILHVPPAVTCSVFSVCTNKKFQSPFMLKPVSYCRYVDILTDKYSNFPYWTHGVHPQMEPDQYLIGYLYVHPDYGMPMLKECKHQMLCVIICADNHNLKQYLDSYVLFGRCFVITEIYSDKSVPNLEYIFVDVNEIKLVKQVVNNYRQMDRLFSKELGGSLQYQHSMAISLENKSVIKYSKQNMTECWLHVKVIECSENDIQRDTCVFLRLTLGNLKWIPLLNCQSLYKVFYNGLLKKVFDVELKRMSPAQSSFELSQGALFCLQQECKSAEQLMDVAACKAYIATQPRVNMVSFVGKLKEKRFSDPLSSRTERHIALYGFGTPGRKTHYLEFQVEGDPVKTLKVYLNNWENSLIPCGLIPNMVVAVRDVAQQKGKYCKSTPLTTFQVLAYDPLVIFNTANLYCALDTEFGGDPFFFGQGKHIPYGALVYGEGVTIQIRSVKIKMDSVEEKVDVSMIVTLRDQFGEAKVISNCESMLQIFLGLNASEYVIWREEFKKARESYEYHITSGGTVVDPLHDMMTCVFNMINAVGLYSLKMCCRKLNSRPSGTDRGMSLWYCVSASKRDRDHLIVVENQDHGTQHLQHYIYGVLNALFPDITL